MTTLWINLKQWKEDALQEHVDYASSKVEHVQAARILALIERIEELERAILLWNCRH